MLRLPAFLSFSSAVPPLADIDLKFEWEMAAGIDRVLFQVPREKLPSRCEGKLLYLRIRAYSQAGGPLLALFEKWV